MFLAAAGPGKCLINHGGCWHETRNGKTFSACQVGLELINEYWSVVALIKVFFKKNSFQESGDGKCRCPAGFRGDGVKKCEGAVPTTISCLCINFFIPFYGSNDSYFGDLKSPFIIVLVTL
jgi:hypothetical protein